MALAPVKVVLKSTTTKTLNDRFTEMSRYKQGANRQNKLREDMISTSRASAKNRRLAEQMSRRTGITTSAVMDKEEIKGNVKNRIDRSRMKSDVKERLGTPNATSGGGVRGRRGGRSSVQSRLGAVQRGGRSRGQPRGRSSVGRGGRFSNRVNGSTQNNSSQNETSDRGSSRGRSSSRGIGRGRGRGRGTGRGRGRGGKPIVANRDNLDSEIDTYMSGTRP